MPREAQPPRLRKCPKSGVWRVVWRDGGRTRRESLGTTEETQAKLRFSYWLAHAGELDDADLTVGDALTLYLEEHVEHSCAAPDRQLHYASLLRAHMGHLKISQIKPGVIHGYTRKRGVKPSTARRELSCLVAALNHCRRTERIEAVPYVPLPPPGEPRDRWLSSKEIQTLLATAAGRGRVELFIWIALETAARKDSILRLAWNKVDFTAGFIDFRNGRETNKRRVAVPISDRLRPVLLAAREAACDAMWVLGHTGPIRRDFERLVADAGLRGVSPHVLRHTAATHMARAGVPLFQIAGILGASMRTVERTYAHHCPDALRGAVNYQRT